jgi:hypothetical protein
MGGGEPFDQSHTGQGGKEASGGAAFSTKGGWGEGRLRARGDGVAASILETATRIVELPVTFPLEPDTSIVNESSSRKSGPAVYEKDGPCTVKVPKRGGETILIAGFDISLNRIPRRQL